MRRFSILAATVALLAVSVTPAVASQGDVATLEVRLVDTQVLGIERMWESDHILHARNAVLTESMVDIDSGAFVGTLSRSVNFNWDQAALAEGEIVSNGTCRFTMEFEDPAFGTIPGTCGGSLLYGHIVGNGEVAHLRGAYQLDPGGVPSVGPYSLTLEITSK